jgi:replicative DNA helicase
LATYGRIALLSPEGDVFDQMAGRYNQQVGPNLGVYLKGHAGDLLKVDRRGRPPNTSSGRV